ncbi:hypothetical protein LTR97_004275 [Elasticomyces elasticus]|uniref:Beta-lactamase-related domain-containing protein n=1 Tax=Elasticomyces elasticus TaxID=574655 RepID=A0AAN7VSH5_9PEZI|nr:hypothetical protein LTR97_004275 [Elasticomyces elasticus]
MHFITPTNIALAIALRSVHADFLGLNNPAPVDLSSAQSHVRAAWSNISAIFDAYYHHNLNISAIKGLVGSENVTWSAGLFSLHDLAATQLQYHYVAPQIANSDLGTREVDGDSIYRSASVTKLITVLTGLLTLTETDWHRSIADIIPEFADGIGGPHAPRWDQITPWLLARQMSGLQAIGTISDTLPLLESIALATNTSLTDLLALSGVPPVARDVLGPCQTINCTVEDWIVSARSPPPVFLPATTTSYSNFGFMVLGLAISRITGKPYDTLYNDTVFAPLNMTSSFVNAPTEDPLLNRSVIAQPLGGAGGFGWSYAANNPGVPSGGILSTIHDLDKLGLAILNSTLMSPEKTREWMKPASHTASLTYSIGAPWEIVRYIHRSTGKVTDIYTKLGDSGAYGGILVLIPDYNAGFSFLNAYYESPEGPQTRGGSALSIINHIAKAVVPALEAQAVAEAVRKYVGVYSSPDAEVNSTIVIGSLALSNASDFAIVPEGLVVQSWISNDIDMLASYYPGAPLRLQLAIPNQTPGAPRSEVTFQGTQNKQWNTYDTAGFGPFTGFYGSNYDWLTYDGLRYGAEGLQTFRFGVDGNGCAVELTNAATRATLVKGRSEGGDRYSR